MKPMDSFCIIGKLSTDESEHGWLYKFWKSNVVDIEFQVFSKSKPKKISQRSQILLQFWIAM